MTRLSFNFYGYSRESYKACAEMIRSTDRKHISILTSWFFLMNFVYLVFSYLNLFGVNEERIPFYSAFMLVSLMFGVWVLFFPKSVDKHIYFAVLSSIFMLLIYGILSSIAQPYMPATMFLVLLLLTSLSYVGSMYIMILISIAGTGIFIFTSYSYKTFSIAYHDTYNVLVVLMLSILLHYSFQRMRIAQFVLYQQDLEIQRKLEIKSSFDSLTGLLNRGRFFSIAEEVLKIKSEGILALCIIDLDGFKQINDTLGHQMGDKVIQVVGKTIMECLRIDIVDKNISSWNLNQPFDFAGRLGGDEFILMLRGKKDREELTAKLKEILEKLNATSFDSVAGIRASVGVVEVFANVKDIDVAYKMADDALYEAKRSGKNQIYFSKKDIREAE
ncbi:GGDEF domain-containing protein [Treponema zioleckii]|uniref:GGDEF domain-containing protein n=1 Tax=Treponema zioleckii TaxID=331680 RepID=UPI00168B4664|nr:GGDEF domain-containing protein [Treponema zioleckii]